MRPIEKIIIVVGILDVAYVAWIALTSVIESTNQLSSLWSNVVVFGLPYPELQFAAIITFYVSILISGIALLMRAKRFAWLNYVQFPFRLLLVVPTLYPLFYIIYKAGIELGTIASFILLTIIETTRVFTVRRWQTHAT